jgi:hypothetical protein
MAYRTNPFLERMSERTTSDQEFVRLFSPKILERLTEDAFEGAVHIFRSPPGGGKTTLLRAFTPSALRAFWNARRVPEMSESFQRLVGLRVLDEQNGPQVLGVVLSCASGYADLPPGASIAQESLFRALLDCRIVLRSLRNLSSLIGFSSADQLQNVRLEYDEVGKDLKSIPTLNSALDLVHWAENRERTVYTELDSVIGNRGREISAQVRFEGVLWLQSVRFSLDGELIAPGRMLMIDDLHKLRRKQRAMLIEEFTELRPAIPVWLAERSIALGDELLSQGTREGRDLHEYGLEELWSAARGQYQFATFAQNILDRRLEIQNLIPSGAFSQYLRGQLQSDDLKVEFERGVAAFSREAERYRPNARYSEWLARADRLVSEPSFESLRDLYVTRILLARDELRRQMTLELAPLPVEELDQRDSSQVQAAAEIFIRDELNVPYYFGIDRLCVMATSNVEELLSLAAVLYEDLQAKQVLRKPDLLLSPIEQEKLLKEVAKRKRDFIPKNHTEGTRAQRLLDAIGYYCRDKTFLPNAPYAPGVTGIRLSGQEIEKLTSGVLMEQGSTLRRVLAESVAENLLVTRASAASTSRDSGTVFYLNRTLCAQYGLPLQMGGWQDVATEDLIDWMERGRLPSRRKLLETR